MSKTFPHLEGADQWPGFGRELYEQVEGSFDPDLWEQGATITLCSVPWGVYEPGASDDVPGFDTPEDRERWFSSWLSDTASETHELETAVRYQMDRTVELPFTFDSLQRYNYLIVDYKTPPVPEAAAPVTRWYYHVTGYDYESPSCTALRLEHDWWCQCACEMDYSHIMLARGHAPMTMVDTDDYLKAPLSHTRWLMGDDESFGELAKLSKSSERVFNSGKMWVVLCFAGADLNPEGLTGRYEAARYTPGMVAQGGPGDYQLAVPADDYTKFMGWFYANHPKYLWSLDAVFLAPDSLVQFDRTYTYGGVTVKAGVKGRQVTTGLVLDKSAFGYPKEAERFAKLYTFPYCVVEVADHEGNVVTVRVEDLAGADVSAVTVFNAAYPWLRVDTHVPGVGGTLRNITFKTLSSHDFAGGGRWWDALMSWGVPCFKVDVSNELINEVQGHWDREQARADALTSYNNALRSNATANTNAKASAATAKANGDASANTAYTNATASNATNNANAKATNATSQANNTRSADNSTAVKDLSNAYNTAIQTFDSEQLLHRTTEGNRLLYDASGATLNSLVSCDIYMTRVQSWMAQNELALTTAMNNLSGGIGMAMNVVGDLTEGELASAGKNVFSQGVSNYMANMASEVAISNNETMFLVNKSVLEGKAVLNQSNAAQNWGYMDVVTDGHTTRTNTLADATNAANVATSKANAAATKATADANADRTRAAADANATRSRDTSLANNDRSYNTSVSNADATKATGDANARATYDNALVAVENGVRTANLAAPSSFGSPANGGTFNVRPMYLSVNVVTQNEGAIDRTAAMFARYGYRLDSEWRFTGFNLCKHFTYWQASSVWATAPYLLPEEGQDKVRRMLYDGVTAWRNPEEIGKVSIYDN